MAVCLIILPTAAYADCPSRRWDTETEARVLMRDSPLIFVGKVIKTRLLRKAGKEEAIFEDEYKIEDKIRGSYSGVKVILRIVSIGDGEETPRTEREYNNYMEIRSGLKLIVLTRGYVDKTGYYKVIADGDCPVVSHANSPHGQDLVTAMKREIERDAK